MTVVIARVSRTVILATAVTLKLPQWRGEKPGGYPRYQVFRVLQVPMETVSVSDRPRKTK